MPPIWGLGFAKGHDADRKSKTKIFSQMVVHDVVSTKKIPNYSNFYNFRASKK